MLSFVHQTNLFDLQLWLAVAVVVLHVGVCSSGGGDDSGDDDTNVDKDYEKSTRI